MHKRERVADKVSKQRAGEHMHTESAVMPLSAEDVVELQFLYKIKKSNRAEFCI